MRINVLLPLLYVGIFGVLFTLSLIAIVAVSDNKASIAAASAPITTLGAGLPVNPALSAGKSVWNDNGCGACHNKSMKDDLIGPALKGVTGRWSAYPGEDLKNWIRNNASLIGKEHPRALEVWKTWKKATMPTYPSLTDEDIDNLLVYIER